MTGLDIANAIFSLLIVLGLIGAIAWLLRRWGGLSDFAGRSLKKPRRLSVSESITVGARHRLVLLRRDDKEYLVLLGPSGETVLDNATAPSKAGNAAIADKDISV